MPGRLPRYGNSFSSDFLVDQTRRGAKPLKLKHWGVGGWHRNHRLIVRGNCPLELRNYNQTPDLAWIDGITLNAGTESILAKAKLELSNPMDGLCLRTPTNKGLL
nr:hypothetical protein Q903MT_gene859 [Picea sitchensis]